MSTPHANGIHWNTFFMQRIGVCLPEPTKLCSVNPSSLRDSLEPAHEMSVGTGYDLRDSLDTIQEAQIQYALAGEITVRIGS
jgi:hypothetical protein